MYPMAIDNANHPKITISKVLNGFQVVYDPGKTEDDAYSMGSQMVEGMMPMLIMAKEQGKASVRGIEEEMDSWKADALEGKDDEDVDKMIDRLKVVDQKLKERRGPQAVKGPRVYVFNDYEEMMAFVAKTMKD